MDDLVNIPPAASYQPASEASAFVNQSGAGFRPRWFERNPSMWAIGETDMTALSTDVLVSNFSFSIGSFFLGCALNVLLSYAGEKNLSDIGGFLLHRCTIGFGLMALFFYVVGFIFYKKKVRLWEQIKSESRLVTPQ
jgi:hypothetical protein